MPRRHRPQMSDGNHLVRSLLPHLPVLPDLHLLERGKLLRPLKSRNVPRQPRRGVVLSVQTLPTPL